MRLGELSQRCGECSLIDLCGEPFEEVSPCTNTVLRDMEEKEYIITAEAIQKHSKKHLSNLDIEIKITNMSNEIKIGTTCPHCIGAGKLKAMQSAMAFNGPSVRVKDTKMECRHCKGTGRRYEENVKDGGL